ncbi:hypothetical protein [Pseudolabrys sp. Root1462]|uniref:T4SS efffector SepA family protein n=1 Tax=Pseudolabrys sp. Root1462 TaxID=1736466 RepID=UPI0012E39118|nr:hypothetical protein [Pseudolabrys sp. Root1462]
MSEKRELLSGTIVRLGKLARPFETVDELINRILDTYEDAIEANSVDDVVSGIEARDFNWRSPPDLTHTKMLSVELNGVKFPRAETTWNSILNEAVRIADQKVAAKEELKRLILVNYVSGKKEDEGYRYLDDVKISVQGQDSNAAWRCVSHIAARLRLPFEIVFTWRVKKGAEYPGVTGRFVYDGSRLAPRLPVPTSSRRVS